MTVSTQYPFIEVDDECRQSVTSPGSLASQASRAKAPCVCVRCGTESMQGRIDGGRDESLVNEIRDGDSITLPAAPDTALTPAADLVASIQEQDQEAAAFALEFVGKLVRLRGVRIDRERFLTAELRRRRVASDVIARAVAERPAAAGVPAQILDEIARQSKAFETKKSTALAFTAGLPGGLALVAAVPADVTQYYIHAFRVMQKLAYLYGWQSFLDDCDEVDDETLAKLGTFLGVMLGVAGASGVVSGFANNVARPALQKQIANKALTKTAYYLPIKQVLRKVGVQINKQIFAKTVTKVVPVLGGVVSGGLTYASLRTGSRRLMQHLQTLPPALPDSRDEDQ